MDTPRHISDPDEELVRRAQHELPFNTDAFETLVERYKQTVYTKLYFMLRHPQDAEDVAQEVFLKVYNSLPAFERRSTFKTWLLAISVNAGLTYIERRKRKSWWWLTEDISEIHEAKKADESLFMLVTEGLERADLKRKIDATMAGLSEKSRTILQLRFYEEMDLQQIADTLNLKLSATKMRLKRAREEFVIIFQRMEE